MTDETQTSVIGQIYTKTTVTGKNWKVTQNQQGPLDFELAAAFTTFLEGLTNLHPIACTLLAKHMPTSPPLPHRHPILNSGYNNPAPVASVLSGDLASELCPGWQHPILGGSCGGDVGGA